MKIKPGQIVILVLGVVAAAAALVYSLGSGGGVKLSHRVTLVDVKTGQLYQVSTDKRPITLPAAAPDGEERLIVAHQEEGKWYVPKRYVPYLKDLPVDPKVIDAESGDVLTPSKDVRWYERK